MEVRREREHQERLRRKEGARRRAAAARTERIARQERERRSREERRRKAHAFALQQAEFRELHSPVEEILTLIAATATYGSNPMEAQRFSILMTHVSDELNRLEIPIQFRADDVERFIEQLRLLETMTSYGKLNEARRPETWRYR